MKVLIIQHETSTPPGTVIQWLESRGASYKIHFFSSGALLQQADFDVVFICGGSMNVDQESDFSWLVEEKMYIHSIIKGNKKIVGLCLGAQLLAEVLGGTVFKSPVWEVGWQKINLLETNTSLVAFHWHGYQFISPPGSVVIAENECTPHQGFKFGANILAYQFHPESTLDWVVECATDPEIPTKDKFVQNKEEILANLNNQKNMQDWFFRELDRFLGIS